MPGVGQFASKRVKILKFLSFFLSFFLSLAFRLQDLRGKKWFVTFLGAGGFMPGGAAGGIVMMFSLMFALGVIAFFATVFSMGFLYKKTGHSNWNAFIPIYNFLVLFRIAKVSSWQAVLFLVFYVFIVQYKILLDMEYRGGFPDDFMWKVFLFVDLFPVSFMELLPGKWFFERVLNEGIRCVLLLSIICVHYRIAKLFGFGWITGVGLVFLPFVFLPYLAFNKKVTYHPERLEWLG